MVKVYEVLNAQPQVQPTAVKQQTAVSKLAQQMAADDATPKPPTGEQVYLAYVMKQKMQKQADLTYAQRMRQQAANAQSQVR